MADTHYNAFISYRHNPLDTQVAEAIQTSLEHFSIPKAIREQYGIEKFERIFRDQEELTINADLAREIEEALDNSDFLIVICSPYYLQSKWCLLEIDTFLKNHDRDHVLCVLSQGDPPGIFPEALLHYEQIQEIDGKKQAVQVDCEPLACDFRGDLKQAKRMELPRLASAMIGCSYDDLMLRQERYRRKRMLSLFAIIFTLTFIAIVYLLYSNDQINRNYRQAQINESKVLAKESLDYFTEKNRLKAIETALAALPANEENRPLRDEAQYALAKATYAYAPPFSYLEAWRIDPVNAISDFFISADENYLVYLEANGDISVIDVRIKEKAAAFPWVSEGAPPKMIAENKDHQLLYYDQGEISCIDYLSGETIWSTPLKYQASELFRLSSDRRYIAANDSYAIQVMDTDGNPFASFPLPDEADGYIADFCWSKDDRRLAVILRQSQGAYVLGEFDFGSGDFTILSDPYLRILDFEYDKQGNLYLLASNEEYSSYFADNEKSYILQECVFLIFKEEEVISTYLKNSGVINEVCVLNDEQLLLILGNNVFLFDQYGGLQETYTLSESITALISSSKDRLDLLCADGSRGSLWLEDGEAYFTRDFPDKIDKLVLFRESKASDNSYVIFKEGDLMIYESVYDDTVAYFEGDDFVSRPEEWIRNNEMMVIKADSRLLFADFDQRNIYNYLDLQEGVYYHLLCLLDKKLYLLRVEEDGECILEIHDLQGEPAEERKLGIRDYTIANALLKYPLGRNEMVYMDNTYASDSWLTIHDLKLYMHDAINYNRLIIHDLESGLNRTIDLNLGDYVLYEADFLSYPSPLLISDDGRYLYTVACSSSKLADRQGVLIDLETGETVFLPEAPASDFCAAFGDDKLFYSGDNALVAVDMKGNELYQLSYQAQQALRIAYYNSTLYVIYPQGRLAMYRSGKLYREVSLSGNDLSQLDSKEYRFMFKFDQLLLFEEDCLDIISLKDDSSLPLASMPEGVMDYLPIPDLYLLYAYNASETDSNYHLATYELYDADALIQRGMKQLNDYIIY